MSNLANLYRLPEELRERKQWCVAGLDPKGTYKAPYISGTNRRASVTDPIQWSDFETALRAANQAGGAHGVGYVLHKDDPFTIIDMDVKPGITTQEHMERYWSIAQWFDSYTEKSQSGNGLHIVVRGNLGLGCKRDGVEMYSQERFIVCTGDIIIDREIVESQEKIDYLAVEMRRADKSIHLEEVESDLEDGEIVDKLTTAVNGEKFTELCKGDWRAMGYPSQSEADLALMSMFCFHSKSNDQCRRLFRMSGLGKREKATRNDVYLNRTLSLIRGRQSDEVASEGHGEEQAKALLANMKAAPVTEQEDVSHIPVPEGSLPWPPGNLGLLAYHITRNSPRPVKEVGIITALGLIAGICGRNYQIPQSGLNMYLVLVARSAVGKEAMHTGISRIINELMLSGVPTAIQYVSFQEFVSGPSLVKAIAENRSFVNVSGEFGRRLKRLSQEDGRDGPMQQLRTVMTNLYQKSSIDSIVGGLSYSDKEKTVASVSGVAYSMIGETTPDTFYQSLTETMMEDGFLSRFTIIEYDGLRPELNERPPQCLPAELKAYLQGILIQAGQPTAVSVRRDAGSEEILRAFNIECDKQINSTNDESWRQMWNRAHLKALRVAALMAAFDHPTHPCMTTTHVLWAIDLIRRDISIMARRISSGDVGSGDAPRERKLLFLVNEYLHTPVGPGYGFSDAMRLDGIIPRKFFQLRLQKMNLFSSHRLGYIKALDDTVRSLMDGGYLQEVERTKLIEKFGFHGKAYRVVSAPKMPHY